MYVHVVSLCVGSQKSNQRFHRRLYDEIRAELFAVSNEKLLGTLLLIQSKQQRIVILVCCDYQYYFAVFFLSQTLDLQMKSK